MIQTEPFLTANLPPVAVTTTPPDDYEHWFYVQRRGLASIKKALARRRICGVDAARMLGYSGA